MVCAVVAAVRKNGTVVRCGGCHISTVFLGHCWVNVVGRVGVISSFPASPAQFNQLKHWLNVISAKICQNQIFAEDAFFFVKKKVHKKKLRANSIFFGIERDVSGTRYAPETRSGTALRAVPILSFNLFFSANILQQ